MEQTDSWEQALSFSTSVLEEYRRAAPQVRGRLSGEEYRAWVEHGARLGDSFRGWQAALEYFRVSPAVLEDLSFGRLPAWAGIGGELAGISADLAAAYFRASPDAVPHLSEAATREWASACADLYRGEWQSGSLAVKLLQTSPQLLRHVAIGEFVEIASLLGSLSETSYGLAGQCLELARDVLPFFEAPQREHIIGLAAVFARKRPELAKEWLMRARAVLSRVGHSEQVRFIHIAEKIAWIERDQLNVLDYLNEGSISLDRLERSLHPHLLVHAEEIVDLSAPAAREFVKAAATLMERLHADELDEWVEEGMYVLKEREDAGIAFFKLESVRAQEVLRRLSRGVELAQIGDVLRLYAKALTGTNVQVLPTESLTQKGIGWTSEKRPTTEGVNIYLPPAIQVYDTKAENFGCMKVYTTHQAGHLEFGSFQFQFGRDGLLFARFRDRVEESQEREARSITDIERFLDLFGVRRLATDVFTVAEDTRVDGFIQREYGGIRPTLGKVQRDSRRGRPAVAALPLRTAILEALLQKTLEPAAPVLLPEEYHPHFTIGWGYLSRLQAKPAAVEDSAEATLRLYILLRSVPNIPPEVAKDLTWRPAQPPEVADPDQAFADFFSLQSSPGQAMGMLLNQADSEPEINAYAPLSDVEFRGDFKPELVQTLMKLKDNKADPNSPVVPLSPDELKSLLDKLGETEVSEFLVGDTDTTSGMFITNLMREAGQTGTPMAGDVRGHEKGDLDGDELAAQEPQEYVYDEWDFRANGYRHNWCLVKEKVLERGLPEFYDETLRKYAKLANEVRRQFELLKPEMFKKIKNLTHGEEYDLDAVIQAVVDRKAKQTPSEKIYWRRNKEERSVAVAFLLDLSASTDEDVKKEREPAEDLRDWDDDPRRYLMYFRERMQQQEKARKNRRRIIDVEKESTVLLIQALETVGDTYGVYGFSGYGRDNVELYVVKDLTEQFGDPVKARIDKMEPVRGTRMGAAIRHATAKLDAFDARVKILFLLSDGRPQDHNYGRDRTEKEYAIHDTKQALMEAKRKQIVPFALTVDREGHDYLKAMCEGIGYEVVEDIESLPERLPTLYRQLTI